MNPFKILAVDRTASKKEILASSASVLRHRTYDIRTVSQAQKVLFSPIDRAEAEFIHCLGRDHLDDRKPDLLPHDAKPALKILPWPDV